MIRRLPFDGGANSEWSLNAKSRACFPREQHANIAVVCKWISACEWNRLHRAPTAIKPDVINACANIRERIHKSHWNMNILCHAELGLWVYYVVYHFLRTRLAGRIVCRRRRGVTFYLFKIAKATRGHAKCRSMSSSGVVGDGEELTWMWN